MDIIKELFSGKSRAQLVMLAAILLNFVSQFFLYLDDAGSAMLWYPMSDQYWTGISYWGEAIGTGWELHPHAMIIIVMLAVVYLRGDLLESKSFGKWGWWIMVAALIAATVPGAYLRAFGGGMGGISVLIAIAAAIMNQRAAKAAPPEPSS
jgi:hypothetical protein